MTQVTGSASSRSQQRQNNETAQLSSQLRQVEAELAKALQITPPAHVATAKATVEGWPFSSWEWIQYTLGTGTGAGTGQIPVASTQGTDSNAEEDLAMVALTCGDCGIAVQLCSPGVFSLPIS